MSQRSEYLSPAWHGPNSGATHEIAKLCQVARRLHDLILEQVWKIRRLLILESFSEVVISHVYLTNVDSLL